MERFITIPSHKAGGRAAAAHGLQAPDRRLPRAHAHANTATWSSTDTGDRGDTDTGHGADRAGAMGP